MAGEKVEKEEKADKKDVLEEFKQKKFSRLPVQKVLIHPTVLLSAVDHHWRIVRNSNAKRVVGVILGRHNATTKQRDITNSFEQVFDEDDKDPEVFYLDCDFLEDFYKMKHKVNARERILGWYHTGTDIQPNDLLVNEVMKKFVDDPVMVIILPLPNPETLIGPPAKAYVQVEEVRDDGKPPAKTFEHIEAEVTASEAEEVGVEHLLRDIRDPTGGSMFQRLQAQMEGLRGLKDKLRMIGDYLAKVGRGEMPINHEINQLAQECLNSLPAVLMTADRSFDRSANSVSNDQAMIVYMGKMIRSVIGLHDLIDNKLALRESERQQEEPPAEQEKEKESKEK